MAKEVKTKSKNFPSIYRTFTDKKNAPFVVVSLLMITALLIVGVDLNKKLEEKSLRQKIYDSKMEEIKFWEKNLSKYPEYRDAYFRIAVLYYEVGNLQKSEEYLKKVFFLDPAFPEGKKLDKFLRD